MMEAKEVVKFSHESNWVRTKEQLNDSDWKNYIKSFETLLPGYLKKLFCQQNSIDFSQKTMSFYANKYGLQKMLHTFLVWRN